MRKTLLFSSVIYFLLCTSVFADLVHLKNGRKLKGEIIADDPTSITLQITIGRIMIEKDRITSIDSDRVISLAPIAAKQTEDAPNESSPQTSKNVTSLKDKTSPHPSAIQRIPGQIPLFSDKATRSNIPYHAPTPIPPNVLVKPKTTDLTGVVMPNTFVPKLTRSKGFQTTIPETQPEIPRHITTLPSKALSVPHEMLHSDIAGHTKPPSGLMDSKE